MMDVVAMIDALIGREGAFSDNPADSGGATMWGVTQQVARAYGYTGDMRALPRDTAVSIYLKRYWKGPGLDALAAIYPALADPLFDCAVNMGPKVAASFVQRALNVLNRGASDYPDIGADGAVGPMTIAALQGYAAKRGTGEGQAVLIWLVNALRAERYVEIAEHNPSQEAFEYGWIARQVRLAAAA